MDLTQYKALIAIARGNTSEDLLLDTLFPALGLKDQDNYWQQATAILALAVAKHQVAGGDYSPERLESTLSELSPDNLLENLSGKARSHYAGMGRNELFSILACLQSLVRKSKRFPMAA